MTRDAVHSALPPLLALVLAFATCTAFVKEAWPVGTFEMAVFALLAVAVATLDWPERPRLPGYIPLLLPLWGLLQIFAGTTTSVAETRTVVLRLAALVAVYVLAFRMGGRELERRLFLDLFLWFATGSAVLCLTQLFTSDGRVLWLFDSGYPDVFGTFAYYNNYAQFVELALPVALWRALCERRHAWAYGVAGGALYASAIGCGSRAGTILTTIELAAMLVIAFARLRGGPADGRRRLGAAMLTIVPIVAIAFTLVVGWERVWQRFFVNDPYVIRREFLVAAVEMTKQRPWIGFGLGTFPAAYQKYAVKDFPFYANHAHNDWAEAAAEGGLPFLAVLLVPILFVAPKTLRHPWAVGLVSVMIHASVDYPFPRPAVSGWIFALLGLLYAVEERTDTNGGHGSFSG